MQRWMNYLIGAGIGLSAGYIVVHGISLHHAWLPMLQLLLLGSAAFFGKRYALRWISFLFHLGLFIFLLYQGMPADYTFIYLLLHTAAVGLKQKSSRTDKKFNLVEKWSLRLIFLLTLLLLMFQAGASMLIFSFYAFLGAVLVWPAETYFRWKKQMKKKADEAVKEMEKMEEPQELRRIFLNYLHTVFQENTVWLFMPSNFPQGTSQEHRYMKEQLEKLSPAKKKEGPFFYTSMEGVIKQAQAVEAGECFILLEKPVLPYVVKAKKAYIKYVLWHMQFIHKFLERRMEREKEVRAGLSRHISQGIHDSLAQQLFFLSAQTFGLKMALPSAAKADQKFMKQLEKMEEAVQEVQTDTRNYIAYLRGDRQERELHESLREMLSRRLDPQGIQWEFRTKGEVVKEKLQVEETIYHVVEELVSNALKHGRISSLELDLDVNTVQWEIKMSDDSKNVPKEINAKKHSYGIEGIRQRTAEVNGDISFHPDEGKGLLVKCVIPRGGEG
ncbi:sensor histidine kinase [Alkalicoccus saliphilus]|uniref:histidine kinase n=1 Tax=Alkalicoccus saliphilus TaxID=200989 RepID=A0A2T4U955_9BACI|nr:histidine kinase [Alkalicoccus saliphilus]PTL39933.1 hypothetical protein C6Y45_02825 [Alkalicoccus saliphilus]